MSKRIAILGSTGSVGKNALQVIENLGADYEVFALSAHNNFELLAEQACRYRPQVIAISNPDHAGKLVELLSGVGTEILTGPEGLEQIALLDEVDIVLTAIVGAAGLSAVFAAARKGKRLAIANKEPLVIAGELLMKTVEDAGGEILPIDSEHSAIFQALQSGSREEVNRIILTASGGPFRGASLADIENVTVDEALAHPVWDMGPKITIDSATMMNKALEIIEAHWLFNITADKIDVLIHPESIVHSLVEFIDGSVIAQLGRPDMCLPIQYALTFPKRVTGIAQHLNFEEIKKLSFDKADHKVFRALPLAYKIAQTGGTSAAVFSAANEAAVQEFLAGRIKFTNIIELIEHCLNRHEVKKTSSVEELLEADAWARREVSECLNRNPC